MASYIWRWRLEVMLALGLILCMSYSLLGEAAHEWLGTAVLAGFLWHLAINRRWFHALGCGRWSKRRVLSTITDGLLCFFTLGLIVSSLMLSKYAFPVLDLPESVGATPHQICATWGFLFVALHLGQHGRGFVRPITERVSLSQNSWRALLGMVCIGGALAFFWQNMPAQLFLQSQGFAPHSGLALYLASYAAIFVLVACLGYRLQKGGRP